MSSIENKNTLIKQDKPPGRNETVSPDIKNTKNEEDEGDKEVEKTEPETGINKWYKIYNKEIFLGLAIILCIEIFTLYKNNLTGVSNTSHTRKRNDYRIINMKGGAPRSSPAGRAAGRPARRAPPCERRSAGARRGWRRGEWRKQGNPRAE